MRQTLTNDFWGLRKIMNCAFPLIVEAEFGIQLDNDCLQP